MFLPDRFIKGECPKCGAQGPVRRLLRGLRRRLRADRAEEPVLGADRRDAGDEVERALLLPPVRPALPRLPAELDDRPGRLQPEVLNKIKEWFTVDEHGDGGLGDWDISRDAPYFGIEIPDAPGKYFYVWLDAPIGYLASLKNYFDKGAQGERRVATSTRSSPTRTVQQVHFIGKDITYFHTLFWPAMLQFSGRKTPDHVFVHGFITVGGDKMSKSRGTGISPLRYLELGLNPEWLRYYIAAKLNSQGRGHRLQPRGLRRPRQRRPGRQVRQHRQPRRRLPRQALRRPALGRPGRRRLGAAGRRCARRATRSSSSTRSASSARRCARSWRWPTRSTSTSTQHKPWDLAKEPAGERRALQDVCSTLHRGLPPAHDLPQAGAAGAGAAGRGEVFLRSRRSRAPTSTRPARRARSAPTRT